MAVGMAVIVVVVVVALVGCGRQGNSWKHRTVAKETRMGLRMFSVSR